MFRYKAFISVFCLGLVMGLSVSAWSLDSLTVDINETAAIVNPEDQNDVRILLKFESITSLDSNDVVIIAQLRSTVDLVNAPDRSILLQVVPLSTAWNANTVSWNSPWASSGGDLVEDLSISGRITNADSQNVKLDVTRIIQKTVSGRITNNGLMLRQVGDLKRQFTIRTLNSPNHSGPMVELVVYFIDRDQVN